MKHRPDPETQAALEALANRLAVEDLIARVYVGGGTLVAMTHSHGDVAGTTDVVGRMWSGQT